MCVGVLHALSFLSRSLRSQSCPFCREQLDEGDKADLWVVVAEDDAEDIRQITRESMRRLFCFIQRLPVIFSEASMPDYETAMLL